MQDLFSLVKEHRCVRKLLTEENKHIDAASNKDTNSQTNQVYMKQKPSHPAHHTKYISTILAITSSTKGGALPMFAVFVIQLHAAIQQPTILYYMETICSKATTIVNRSNNQVTN